MTKKKTTATKGTATKKEEEEVKEPEVTAVTEEPTTEAPPSAAETEPADVPPVDEPSASEAAEAEEQPKQKIDRNIIVHVRTAPNVRTAVLGGKAIFDSEVHAVPYRIYQASFAPGKFAIKYPGASGYVVESEL